VGGNATNEGEHVRKRYGLALALAGMLALGTAACGSDDNSGGDNLSGKISIDGSSTVLPFAQAAAELFNEDNPDVKITVGSSGTGGGFEKFCAGETDISDASRPIKPDEEVPLCKKNGVTYQEIQVANDGIAVVTNKSLSIPCMSVDQLSKLWDKGSSVKTYNQIDPQFPNTPVSLFGPGTDSGTFDFFTEKVNGEEGQSRSDYQPSEDDNVTVKGVSGSAGGLGYFGFSYYEQAQDKVNLVAVSEKSGGPCVKPSQQTIQNNTYKPLSRPLFMYPSEKAMAQPQVKAFMEFVLANQAEIAKASQIVPMTPAQVTEGKAELKQAEAKAGT
jgi:phosphate transport system substrate-binding protein